METKPEGGAADSWPRPSPLTPPHVYNPSPGHTPWPHPLAVAAPLNKSCNYGHRKVRFFKLALFLRVGALCCEIVSERLASGSRSEAGQQKPAAETLLQEQTEGVLDQPEKIRGNI